METVNLTIDGFPIEVPKGATVLDAALANGIYVPHLCHHPDLRSVGVCRLCMVEIEKRGNAIGCKTPAENGMVVRTETPAIRDMRRVAVELIMVNHHGECLTCNKSATCKLQEVARYVGVRPEQLTRLRQPGPQFEIDDSNPFFVRDMNKCVLCGICVRTCEEIQGVSALDFAYRGFSSVVTTFGDRPMVASRCESCGECVVRCPVGALAPKNAQTPAREVLTTCPYCGCGCGIYLGVRGGTVLSARGDPSNPVNHGRLCVKGRFGHEFVNHPDRLTSPMVKRNGEFVAVGWDEALDIVARGFASHKGEQFAMIASAKCTNEENYVLQKFARVVMGTNNVDHCARLCHAPTLAGLARAFGSGAMTNTIGEIADAACILAIGSNATRAHPMVGLEVRAAARKGARVIVADPRVTELCRSATIHLQQKPGTDVALLMGMARVIVDEGLYDAAFVEARTADFAAFRASLAAFDLDSVSAITGVPKESIAAAARAYATNKPASIIYAMGITQHSHGTDNVLAVANLALLTGNLGLRSSGVNPLRGQNNVQGACDMGALPNVYPGYQQVSNPEVKAKFEAAWGCELGEKPGLTLTEMLHAAKEGQIKAIYLVGENPALSEADANHVVEALAATEFLVVQDIFMSETARLADIVLPAATYAEKDGTFTNTERRVQRVRRAIQPVGASKPDWEIACEIAKRLGGVGFDYRQAGEIMVEAAALTPSYKGISYERLESGGLQWPCPDESHPGTSVLHAQRFNTPDGKAKFTPLAYRPSVELPDAEYPLLLTTGRSLFHYHTGTMTRRSAGLDSLHSREWLEINPADAKTLGIGDGETVRVASRRGEVEVRALPTTACPPGVVHLTFHFSEVPTNVLTSPAVDPVSKIPETKVCAVRIERVGVEAGAQAP